jgi:amino acid transporter
VVWWTPLVGYVGSMAMYVFAFGEFAVAFDVVPTRLAGLRVRVLTSVLAVAGFVGLNLLGARTAGVPENVHVALELGILVAFGIIGLVYAFGFSGASFEFAPAGSVGSDSSWPPRSRSWPSRAGSPSTTTKRAPRIPSRRSARRSTSLSRPPSRSTCSWGC